MTEPGKATLLAIFNEVRAGREDVKNAVADHETRIRVLERKNMTASAIVSGIVSVIVALTTLFASGCATSQSVGDLSRATTVEVQAAQVSLYGLSGWTGTGWYIASDGDTSVLATAGHVCDSTSYTTSYSTSDGRTAWVIYDHDEDNDDTCLLAVSGSAPVLSIGGVPRPGEKVTYTGYPDGIIGTYHGEVSEVDKDGVVLVSVPGYFGSSGSAVISDRTHKVVGMLVRGDMRFQGHAWLVGSAALRRAQAFARHFLEKPVIAWMPDTVEIKVVE